MKSAQQRNFHQKEINKPDECVCLCVAISIVAVVNFSSLHCALQCNLSDTTHTTAVANARQASQTNS